jgi:putative Ca2+/H+ antiporter (TMEM165/GDT1 family)
VREILEAFLLSFGVVFIAELGDKSQLLALLFATRLSSRGKSGPWLVIFGITVASGLVHLVSVGAGSYLGDAVDPRLTTLFAGAALVGCGLWGLRERTSEQEAATLVAAPTGWLSAVATVVSAFLLAELGDKTMFATVALGAGHSFFGVWLGSTAGMVVADALAILLGLGLAKRVPHGKLMVWANMMFLALGAWFLVEGCWRFAPALGWAAAAGLLVGAVLAVLLVRSRNRNPGNRQLLGSQR